MTMRCHDCQVVKAVVEESGSAFPFPMDAIVAGDAIAGCDVSIQSRMDCRAFSLR